MAIINILLKCHHNVSIFNVGSRKKQAPTLIDEIIYRLQSLNLNGSGSGLQKQDQNALVLYKRDVAVVPYDGMEFLKKRKPRPKVDLDPETNRIWNLLMGKEGGEEPEGTDKEKEKWWEEERKVFSGRVDSFIARMHLVQGAFSYLKVLHILSLTDFAMLNMFYIYRAIHSLDNRTVPLN